MTTELTDARVFVTNSKGGVGCWPVATFAELEGRIRRAYRRRLEAIAYAPDPNEEEGRRVIGRVEKNRIDGRWIWWCEAEEACKR